LLDENRTGFSPNLQSETACRVVISNFRSPSAGWDGINTSVHGTGRVLPCGLPRVGTAAGHIPTSFHNGHLHCCLLVCMQSILEGRRYLRICSWQSSWRHHDVLRDQCFIPQTAARPTVPTTRISKSSGRISQVECPGKPMRASIHLPGGAEDALAAAAIANFASCESYRIIHRKKKNSALLGKRLTCDYFTLLIDACQVQIRSRACRGCENVHTQWLQAHRNTRSDSGIVLPENLGSPAVFRPECVWML
jgi:hypothetical protein